MSKQAHDIGNADSLRIVFQRFNPNFLTMSEHSLPAHNDPAVSALAMAQTKSYMCARYLQALDLCVFAKAVDAWRVNEINLAAFQRARVRLPL